MSQKVIAGYKVIMELDLSNVHPAYHKELINRHKKDIEDYKLYQASLDPEMQYENTIQKIIDDKELYDKKRDAKIEKEQLEHDIYSRERSEIYSRL